MAVVEFWRVRCRFPTSGESPGCVEFDCEFQSVIGKHSALYICIRRRYASSSRKSKKEICRISFLRLAESQKGAPIMCIGSASQSDHGIAH